MNSRKDVFSWAQAQCVRAVFVSAGPPVGPNSMRSRGMNPGAVGAGRRETFFFANQSESPMIHAAPSGLAFPPGSNSRGLPRPAPPGRGSPAFSATRGAGSARAVGPEYTRAR